VPEEGVAERFGKSGIGLGSLVPFGPGWVVGVGGVCRDVDGREPEEEV
jgi:hypothetical protein